LACGRNAAQRDRLRSGKVAIIADMAAIGAKQSTVKTWLVDAQAPVRNL
jgi:hypothetical protein